VPLDGMKPTHVKDWITRKNTLNTSSFPKKNFEHQFFSGFFFVLPKKLELCHVFPNWTLPFLQRKTEENLSSKTPCP
jgi:hypothetical protein